MVPGYGLATRREFLLQCGSFSVVILPFDFRSKNLNMKNKSFDVILIGGSYAGLAAAMALGRALRNVLVIDAGKPANRFTPHSHNFITHDGKTPGEISSIARQQVEQYRSVIFKHGFAKYARRGANAFVVELETGEEYEGRKLIFASGIVDRLPEIQGLQECWGKSVLHCPYCHGYEVRNRKTGILGNGDAGVEFAALISNWSSQLTLYTNGKSRLSALQSSKLESKSIRVVENEIVSVTHEQGQLKSILFGDGHSEDVDVLYTRPEFTQHSGIPAQLGCDHTEEGYIKTDHAMQTNIRGVFACGDNASKMRTVANAVAMGTAAGMMVNKELVMEDF